MEVTITLKEILKAASAPLDGQKFSRSAGFILAANLRALQPFVEIHQKEYTSLIERLSIKNEKGEQIIPPQNVQEFARELEDLTNTKINLTITKIKLDDLPSELDYAVLDKLYFMIDGGEP